MAASKKPIVILAGLLLALASLGVHGPGRPSFDTRVTVRGFDPQSADPCGPHHPIVGICRMLRPVRG